MVITAGPSALAIPGGNAAALRTVADAQDALDDLGAGLRRRMADLHAHQDAFEKAVNKQAKSLKSLVSNSSLVPPPPPPSHPDRTALPATKPPRPTRNGAPNHPTPLSKPVSPEPISPEPVDPELWEEDVSQLQHRLKEMQLLMPATGGMFVELFLGSINVRFVRKSERMAFKREYEKLKMKLAPVFVIFCLLCLYLEDYRWLHMCLQLSLSCYYVTLAVRENILRANGSNIRAWWIIHHYFTMMQGVLLLTWPDGQSYARFRRPLHIFGLYNAVLMIFQTRYQMARLYTLRSLGMANEMDVASSDSTQIHWSETMRLLLPLIVFGQIMQGIQAYRLFTIYKDYPKELQILCLSLLSLANFIGNSTTTMQVLLAKRKQKAPPSTRHLPPTNSNSPALLSTAFDNIEPPTRQERKKNS